MKCINETDLMSKGIDDEVDVVDKVGEVQEDGRVRDFATISNP